jgi:hypothetical protein
MVEAGGIGEGGGGGATAAEVIDGSSTRHVAACLQSPCPPALG